MKKRFTIPTYVIVAVSLAGCSEKEPYCRIETTATVHFTAPEQVEVADSELLLFDAEGFFIGNIHGDEQQTLGDHRAEFSTLSGIHTILAFINSESFDITPSDPEVGQTHISGIRAAAKQATTAGNKPFCWYGQISEHIHPDLKTSFTIPLQKITELSFGLTINPWVGRETNVDIGG